MAAILWLYREIELVIDTDGVMTLAVSTELPGRGMAVRAYLPVDTTTTTGRRPVNLRLPGTTQGQLIQAQLYGIHTARLYSARVYAKPLGAEGAWAWYPLPVVETPDGYGKAELPIVPTPEAFADARLPIVATPEGFADLALPIAPTAADWNWVELPVDET